MEPGEEEGVVVMRNMTLSDMHSFTTCNCTSSVIAGQGPSQVTSANATEPGENNPPACVRQTSALLLSPPSYPSNLLSLGSLDISDPRLSTS